MNAETRAKEIVGELASRLMAHGWSEDVHHPLLLHVESLIAQALRQAQNDKLEEAARVAEQAHLGVSCFVDAVDCGQFNSGVRHAAKAVRSLKPKD